MPIYLPLTIIKKKNIFCDVLLSIFAAKFFNVKLKFKRNEKKHFNHGYLCNGSI